MLENINNLFDSNLSCKTQALCHNGGRWKLATWSTGSQPEFALRNPSIFFPSLVESLLGKTTAIGQGVISRGLCEVNSPPEPSLELTAAMLNSALE
jgi:hypothetical protein